MSAHRVLLLRHGETHGYFDDVGLTDRGELQARTAGTALASMLPDAARVRLPHAPTARATATAVTLRAALVAALDPGSEVNVGPLEPDERFDSIRFLHGDRARESSAVAADRLRLHPGAPRPDWAVEYDRFDTDYGAGSRLGGPIDRWMTAVGRHFEPPQVVVYRAWAGIVGLAREAEVVASGPAIALVSSHSALLRAFVAAALGHDPGEPANLEQVVVDVDLAAGTAFVAFRDEQVVVELPHRPPPWIAAEYLAPRIG